MGGRAWISAALLAFAAIGALRFAVHWAIIVQIRKNLSRNDLKGDWIT
jgi:hypothetical protein